MRTDSSGRSSAQYIGRVGVLAVALGVGSAIMGLTAVAVAEPGPDNTAGSAGQETSPSGIAGTATGRSRNSNRGGLAPASSPAPTAAAGRRAGTVRSGQAVAVTPTGSTDTPAVTLPQSPADLISALLTPGGMSNLVQQAMTSLIADLFAAVPADALVPDAAVTPEITAMPSAEVTPAEAAPAMTAQPDEVSVVDGSAQDALGGGSGDPVAATLAWAAVAASRQDPAAATPEMAPAATVTTGEPVDTAAAAPGYEDFLKLPDPVGIDLTRGELFKFRATIVNNIAQSFATAFGLGTIAEADKCSKDKGGCPAPLSLPNTVGMYAFNVVYALMGDLPSDKIATTVQQLASQPIILDFIASTVAANISANNPNVPSAIANLVGTAVKTFVSNTFGSTAGPAGQANYVALQFVPFLKALNLPTNWAVAGLWLKSLEGTPAEANAAILGRFTKAQQAKGQQALVSFFGNRDVQGYLDSAFTSSFNVLLVPTMANYLGENVATQILGAGNPDIPTLGATIGNAISGLFSSIGGVVATQAGNAFGTFLNAPGQNIPTVLANAGVNGYVAFLSPKDTPPVLPYPQGELAPLIASAAGVAVTSFVTAVLTDPTVPPALRTFVNTLIPGMLANPGFDEVLGGMAEAEVIKLLGQSPLSNAIAVQVNTAVSNLVAVPVVANALTTWAVLLFGSILAAPGAVTALAGAAGQLVSADLAGTSETVRPQVIAELRANAAIANAVGSSVSSGVVALFGSAEVLSAVNTATVSLVTALLGDPAVQSTLAAQIAYDVSKSLNDTPLGQAVGTQVGAAVVGLLGNPATRSALVGLVDTMVGDFFGYPGVVTAISKAAGTLAAAEYQGTQREVLPVVQAELKANTAIQNAVGVAVGSAVTTMLTDPALLDALDSTASSLVAGLLGDPDVQAGLSDAVANLFGDSPLGQVIGVQAGNAVVGLLSQQAVRDALAGLVDTELGDFFRSPGVVAAFAGAANTYALALITDADPKTAAKDAEAALRASTAIQNAVGGIVTTSVTELLNDSAVWSAVDTAATRLVQGLLADAQVQQALAAQVTVSVATIFNNTPLGNAVGAQAGVAVVRLLSNPDVSAALVGVVDTVFTDFFGTPGVIAAFADAAGTLAAAEVAGTQKDVLPVIQAELKANTAVQTGVNVAVGDAVQTLLTDPKVLAQLDQAAASVVTGVLADPAVQTALSTQVAAVVSKALGDGPLGLAVGAQAGNAIAGLLSQQSVRDALGGLVDTELGDFFQSPGVVAAIVGAANTFALDVITDGDVTAAQKAAVQSLRTSTPIQNAVGGIATASVAELLGDTALWNTIDTAAANLVTRTLADTAVQQGVSERVSTAVAKTFNDTALGLAIGDQVAGTVVALMSNPVISAGLSGVVDTVFKDFFGTPGVVTAFSDAAGELAVAAVVGDVPTVWPQVQIELQSNEAVQAGVNLAVGDAVTTLLTDNSVLNALDANLAALVSGLLGDPDVQSGLDAIVAARVSNLLGDGALGQAVGAQVGTAVVEILSNPIVKDALEGLVDTELGDFFRAPGVVSAFAAAADTFALDVFTGENAISSLAEVEAQLRTNAAIDTAVNQIVTASVAELLGNENVWAAVDGTSRRLVSDLLGSTEVQQAVAARVYANVWVAFNGTQLGVVVANKVADAVVSLMQDPAVIVALDGLVDSVTSDFFSVPGVVTAFSDAAGELAAAAVAGDLPTVGPQVQAQLRANQAVEYATGLAVGDAVTTLLTDDTVLDALDQKAAAVITDLLADQTVQARLNEQIVIGVSAFVGGGDLGQAVGTQAATAVSTFLSDPSVQAALVSLVDDELGNFFRSPGVVAAFAGAANTLALDVITGMDVKKALAKAEESVRTSPAVDDAVVGVVTESVGSLLSNANVIQAADSGLTTLLTNLGPYAGQLVTVLVIKSLPDSPIAAPIGQALGAAMDQLLAVPGFGSGLVTVIASVLPDFLDQFGVPSAVAGIIGDYAAALVAGENPTVALEAAQAALRANPTIDSAAKTTVADTLTLVNLELLSNTAIQDAIGATVATLITTLAANPAIQAFVEQTEGPVVAELLANTAVVGEAASLVGSVITQFLGYPGFTAALLDAVNVFADDVIDGTEITTASASALQGLRKAPAVVGAVNAVIPPAVNSLLDYANVRLALGVAAREEIINSLQKAGINNAFLDRTFGQVADATVESLTTKNAGITLVDNIVVNIVLGMPFSDWRGFTAQEIIEKPLLQIAFGTSLGQGIGSLFGDNIFGQLIGVVAAVPATLVVGATSALVGFLQLLFGRPTYGPGPAAAHANHNIRADLYLTNTVILSPVGVAS